MSLGTVIAPATHTLSKQDAVSALHQLLVASEKGEPCPWLAESVWPTKLGQAVCLQSLML